MAPRAIVCEVYSWYSKFTTTVRDESFWYSTYLLTPRRCTHRRVALQSLSPPQVTSNHLIVAWHLSAWVCMPAASRRLSGLLQGCCNITRFFTVSHPRFSAVIADTLCWGCFAVALIWDLVWLQTTTLGQETCKCSFWTNHSSYSGVRAALETVLISVTEFGLNSWRKRQFFMAVTRCRWQIEFTVLLTCI